MSFKRADRVAESIKREISVLILQELKDPDVQNATVTDVETSDDLRHAKVFVSVMGDDAVKKRTMNGLERAKGFLRAQIAHRLGLRFAPELSIKLDRSLDHAMRIEEILNDLKSRERDLHRENGDAEPPKEGPNP